MRVVRRREQLVTARTVDRFSEHIRVLDRRSSRPTGPGGGSSSSSGGGASLLAAGALARRTAADQGADVQEAMTADLQAASSSSMTGRSEIRRRRIRAYAFLAASGSTLLGASTAFVGALSWWVPVSTAAAALSLFGRVWWEHQMTAVRRVSAGADYGENGFDSMAVESAAAVDAAITGERAMTQPVEVEGPSSQTRALPEESVDRKERVERLAVRDRARGVAGSGWQPMPVPRPLYAMKAQAPAIEPDTEEIPVLPAVRAWEHSDRPDRQVAVGE
ncbi:hypothetical protein [Austwickia chelonae]|uniref:hypothetical protein n=1 Tax=Austwickia chelonae TaxID=100225 RepID=UPI000E242689|nr:hypothetical protein [Austwickia chelonae]